MNMAIYECGLCHRELEMQLEMLVCNIWHPDGLEYCFCSSDCFVDWLIKRKGMSNGTRPWILVVCRKALQDYLVESIVKEVKGIE